MIIIILGPQGSGKGTQGKLLAKEFGLTYISTGDVLRQTSLEDDSLREKLDKGILLSDETVIETFKNYINAKNVKDDLVLDGIPRRITQYEALIEILGKVDLAIYLTISKEESIRRLSARRQDPVTGKVYNLATAPKPPKEMEATLIQRDDDKPSAILKRLAEFDKDTKPLIDVLEKEGILVRVNGEKEIEQIHKNLVRIVNTKLHGKN